MLGRGLAAFAAVAAVLVVGPSAASGQENPVLDPESAQLVIPYSVAQQLAAAPGRLPSVGPGPDHPWAPSGAPFPLNVTYVTGSYRNASGSTTVVYCLLDVAAEHPYWYQENMIRTWAVGGARCNVRLAEEAGGAMTGTVRARGFPSGSQLASAPLGSQHQVPEGQGSGWQAYGIAEYDRASTNSNQQVQLEATLVLPAWPGWTNIGWNTFGPGCERGSNNREVNCQFSSPPFQTLPYPCPDSPFQGGKLGFQPGACYDPPEACDVVSGRYGIEPNCVSTAPETVIEDGPPPVTKSTSATFKFRSDQPFATFECRLDSGAWAACSSPKTYTGLADGTHVFQVRAKNAIGQADQSPASHTWRVDTVPPDTTITSGPPQFSNSPTAEFAFSPNEADVSFECQLDSAAWEPCVSPKRYVELAETAHTFRVRGTDPAGNLEPTPATYTWTVDLTPPETTITGGPSGPTPSTSATFSFAGSEPGSFECRLDAGGFAACSSPKSYSGLSEGSHTFVVRAIDRAGNIDGTPASRQWSAHAAPSLSLSGPLVDSQGAPLTDDVYELWIDADSTIGMRSIEVKVDGQRADYVSEPCPADDDLCSEDRVFAFRPDNYAAGSHNVTIVATDVLGSSRQTAVTANVGTANDPSLSTSTTSAPQSGSDVGCTPFEPGSVEEGVDLIVHGAWAAGTETTEYFSSDEYRISRCSSTGELVIRQYVAPIVLPSAEVVPVPMSETLRVPALDAETLTANYEYLTVSVSYRDPAGTTSVDWAAEIAQVIPPTPTNEQLPAGDHNTDPPGGSDLGCQREDFVRLSRWTFNPRYRIHTDSLPHGGKSKRRIVDGHQVWNTTSDNCGLRDRTDFRMVFDGRSSHRVRFNDHEDTIDFGPIKGDFAIGECGRNTIACTYTDSGGDGVLQAQDEVDIRFSNNIPWSSKLGPPGDRYDLFSTAAHEAGHYLGLDHVPARSDQTMCSPCGSPGVRFRRTLGKGDVRGMRRIYDGGSLGPDPRS
jgi:matrixin